MTGFALIVWIALMCCIERVHLSRIKMLESYINELKRERRVVVPELEANAELRWTEIPLPHGSLLLNEEGFHERDSVLVLTYHRKMIKVAPHG